MVFDVVSVLYPCYIVHSTLVYIELIYVYAGFVVFACSFVPLNSQGFVVVVVCKIKSSIK